MPKINVYLPDDLAETVKDVGLPVSAICQRALEQSVKRVTAIRTAVLGELDPTAGLTQFTQRAKDVLNMAIEHAWDRGAEEIGTLDLLHAMIAQGTNLGLHVLRSMEVEPAQVQKELERHTEQGDGDGAGNRRVGRTAANALELTVVEALTLGHNYVGCEHLLIGLVAEPDGTAGQVLRGMGVEARSARQAVSAALAGYQQANQAGDVITVAVGKALEPVLRRLDRLEEKAGLN
jgi:ATP-dependent Clp protease ATP-binding subunit ClpA/post-segregation antitoxin (ccd killing protein)